MDKKYTQERLHRNAKEETANLPKRSRDLTRYPDDDELFLGDALVHSQSSSERL